MVAVSKCLYSIKLNIESRLGTVLVLGIQRQVEHARHSMEETHS